MATLGMLRDADTENPTSIYDDIAAVILDSLLTPEPRSNDPTNPNFLFPSGLGFGGTPMPGSGLLGPVPDDKK